MIVPAYLPDVSAQRLWELGAGHIIKFDYVHLQPDNKRRPDVSLRLKYVLHQQAPIFSGGEYNAGIWQPRASYNYGAWHGNWQFMHKLNTDRHHLVAEFRHNTWMPYPHDFVFSRKRGRPEDNPVHENKCFWFMRKLEGWYPNSVDGSQLHSIWLNNGRFLTEVDEHEVF